MVHQQLRLLLVIFCKSKCLKNISGHLVTLSIPKVVKIAKKCQLWQSLRFCLMLMSYAHLYDRLLQLRLFEVFNVHWQLEKKPKSSKMPESRTAF